MEVKRTAAPTEARRRIHIQIQEQRKRQSYLDVDNYRPGVVDDESEVLQCKIILTQCNSLWYHFGGLSYWLFWAPPSEY